MAGRVRFAGLLGALALVACQGTTPPGDRTTAPKYDGFVDGVVYDEEGRPLLGARVRVIYSEGEEQERIYTKLTGRGGRCRMEGMPPGAAIIEASASGYFPRRESITVYSTKPVTGTVRLERTRVITGQVLFHGRAIEGARIAAHPEDPGGTEMGWSDATGEFLVGGVRPKPYRLVLHVPAATRLDDGAFLFAQDQTAPATGGGPPVRFEIPVGAGVDATAREAVSIAVAGRRYPVGEGKVSIRGIPPGKQRVTFHASSGASESVDVVLEAGKTLAVAEPGE